MATKRQDGRSDQRKSRGGSPVKKQTVDSILAATEGWSTEARAELIKQLEKQQVEVGGISQEAALASIERPDAREILRILKAEFGMTQRDVAEAIGRNQSTIANISSGVSINPRIDLVISLQELLQKYQESARSEA